MKTFGVCIQTPVFAVQNPQSVVEAIEILRLLGAEHFTLYIHSVTAWVMDVLETYAEEYQIHPGTYVGAYLVLQHQTYCHCVT